VIGRSGSLRLTFNFACLEGTDEGAGRRQMFPNRIKQGKVMKLGPIWHEAILGRRIQPVARKLSRPHITWRLLRH
jgi:hypothetical protein